MTISAKRRVHGCKYYVCSHLKFLRFFSVKKWSNRNKNYIFMIGLPSSIRPDTNEWEKIHSNFALSASYFPIAIDRDKKLSTNLWRAPNLKLTWANFENRVVHNAPHSRLAMFEWFLSKNNQGEKCALRQLSFLCFHRCHSHTHDFSAPPGAFFPSLLVRFYIHIRLHCIYMWNSSTRDICLRYASISHVLVFIFIHCFVLVEYTPNIYITIGRQQKSN